MDQYVLFGTIIALLIVVLYMYINPPRPIVLNFEAKTDNIQEQMDLMKKVSNQIYGN